MSLFLNICNDIYSVYNPRNTLITLSASIGVSNVLDFDIFSLRGYAEKEGDARQIHPKLRPPVDQRELEIDERTGMKVHILFVGSWPLCDLVLVELYGIRE